MTHQILIIDDDADIGEVLSLAAEVFGWNCTVTATPSAFFENLTPDVTLVLLDLMMPAMGGLQIMQLLAERRCRAGLVLMSGLDTSEIEQGVQWAQSLGLHVIGHLQKPFRFPELEILLAPSEELRACG